MNHHPFSPSQLAALECCPAYQGQQTSSEASERGTKLHAIAETGIDDAAMSDEDVADASAAMQFAERQKWILQEQAAIFGGEVLDFREKYLPVDEEVIYVPDTAGDHGEIGYIGTTAGTADRILISGDRKRAILVDYKYGKWAVPHARENRQSDAYALGVFFAYPTVESVQVHFFQPAIDTENTHTWTRADVPELLLRIRVIVARAKAAREKGDFSAANPTTPTCLFCKHLAVCPAVASKVLSVAKKFSPVEVEALDLTPTKIHEPEQAAAGMRLAGLVENWAKAFKSLVADRVLRGGPLPFGYDLQSRTTREIVDHAAFKKVAEAYLTTEEIESTIEIGMTKIEKLIAQKAPRGMKTATIEAFQAETEQAGAIEKKAPYAFLKQIPQ